MSKKKGSFFKVFQIALVLVASASSAQAGHRRQVLTASDLEKRYSVSEVAAMASKGPLGAYGPLASLGPVGSVSVVMKSIGNWSGFSEFLTSIGGPLSADGPLGEDGPIGRELRNFPEVFQEDGDFAVMGNVGVLGALGPLGPLGPMGAHGFAVDSEGRYRTRSGQVVKSIVTPYDQGCSREFELFEVLQDRFARQELNDTSWMTIDQLSRVGESVSYLIRSNLRQAVSVLVVPEAELDTFHLEVLNRKGQSVAKSESNQLMNWVELPAQAGGEFEIKVRFANTYHFLRHSFRLIVVGAGSSWECQKK